MTLSTQELDDLARARRLLESRGLAIRLTELLGRPIEKGLLLLPAPARETVQDITHAALERALRAALLTMRTSRPRQRSAERFHRLAGAATGAAGGVFGLGGLAIELPLTTVLMFRSIADIARSEGHDLRRPETGLACLEVFAFGGPAGGADAAETAYYAVRGTLAKALSDAASHLARHGMSQRGAPVLVRLVDKIAARFGIVVQEKVALEAVPLVGAVSGALINTVFMEHFQNVARGHFIVLRLEALHGRDAVEESYGLVLDRVED